jgi:hypothetical protein
VAASDGGCDWLDWSDATVNRRLECSNGKKIPRGREVIGLDRLRGRSSI